MVSLIPCSVVDYIAKDVGSARCESECIYACMRTIACVLCVCEFVCVRVLVRAFVHACAYVCVRVHACARVRACASGCACVHTYQ